MTIDKGVHDHGHPLAEPDEVVLNIGRRVCKDCRRALPPERMFRCAPCLEIRIDRILQEAKHD
jgi:hypothetical protein